MTRWLLPSVVPDLAGAMALAALVYCLFVFGAGEALFRDSDTGWHIRTGEWILAHRVLPQGDLYSFSKPGEPWFAWEWSSDLLMALANRAMGLGGIVAMYSLAIAASIWLVVKLTLAAGGDFLLTALATIPIVTTTSLHWLARPHVLSWILLLVWMLWMTSLQRTADDGSWLRSNAFGLFFAAAFTALWANVHGSFFFAPALAVVYAAANRSSKMIWIAAASALGSLINPYGWQLHVHLFRYLTDEDLTSRVAEFQSFNFHDAQAGWVVVALMLTMAGGILALLHRNFAHAAVALGLTAAGLRSARALPILALAGLPLAVAAISRELRPRFKAFFHESDGLARVSRPLNGYATLLAAAAFVVAASPAIAKGFPTDRFPVQAASAVSKLPADARLLTNDSYGGYLIYRFNGERKVFFDGRSDYYGADFMKQYLTLSQARPGWQAFVDKYAFTHALLPADSALADALERSGWTRLYSDKLALLLEKH